MKASVFLEIGQKISQPNVNRVSCIYLWGKRFNLVYLAIFFYFNPFSKFIIHFLITVGKKCKNTYMGKIKTMHVLSSKNDNDSHRKIYPNIVPSENTPETIAWQLF
jgi:hypothetical protein